MNPKHAGFTLIEMMVVVALIGLLAMLASPFTTAWVEHARLNTAEGIWREAYGRAKAAALRNPHGIGGGRAASFICLGKDQLTVRSARDADTPASCTSPVLWQARLPEKLTTRPKAGSHALVCMSFNNRGSSSTEATCAGNELELVYGRSSLSVSLH